MLRNCIDPLDEMPSQDSSSAPWSFRWLSVLPLVVIASSLVAAISPEAAGQATDVRQFPVGALQRPDELPAGRFRDQIERLPPTARGRAMDWLRGFHFPANDVAAMHADAEGGICYHCEFGHVHQPEESNSEPQAEEPAPQIEQAAVPVSPFPDSLKFHSRPGLTKRIYVNFVGQTVTGTAWNNTLGRTTIVALPYSTDADTTTFSDAEQIAIKRVWQRMAEDFAPFDIDVTTERPAVINSTTAIVLITRNTDANGDPNPASAAGGVAYVGVFGASNFISTYSPAWVYHNNLGNSESNIAEAASHEIGHNLGLSHDGNALPAADYYSGHGLSSDPISWGPLMGTGYGRNVSQWSKGEYFNSNNTQDDLAVIAGKTAYRNDDHGGTPGTATPLAITGGTTISSTTPQNDPTNASSANKGVIERNTDVDVFSFVTGAGTVQLNVNPWIQPADTRGGNLDLVLELYNEAGSLVASNNPAGLTTASISAAVPQGLYFLHLRNTGTGNPLVSPPTGYTAYGTIGQYFISGTVVDGSGFIVPPVAEGQFGSLTTSGQSSHTFTVTYSDNVAINVATIGTGDVRVTGRDGYNVLAQFVSVNSTINGTPRSATYSVTPAGGGSWSAAQNGTYIVSMEPGQVQDTEGAFVAAEQLGQFEIAIPVPLYTANMAANPGWTLGTHWSYGQPSYGNGGPTSGFTGNNVIGHSMSGNYAKGLAMAYATTPLITNAASASSLTLRFRRWLGLKKNDTAIIEVSGNNGITWVALWSTNAAVGDSGWQLMQYTLPQSVVGSSQLRFRWGLSTVSSPGNSPTAIGWHLDDVELLGGGALDASPPTAFLSVANITTGGSPGHSCTVTYADSTAVVLSSLDPADLAIIGPAGPLYPLTIESVGTDLSGNGTPMSGTYSMVAPGGTWDVSDNGTYTITLQEGAVEDTLGNVTPETVLGTFTVNISSLTPGLLLVTPPGDLATAGNSGGDFTSSSIQYSLTNSGQTALNWTAAKTADWVSLSSAGGTLAAGASTLVTVSINSTASSLAAGSYSDTVAFSNTSNNNGNSTRAVAMTVNPIPVTVTLGSLNQTYDGNRKPVTVTTNPTPRAYSVTYNGQATVPVSAGTYSVLATVTEPNHQGSASGSLVIDKATQTINFAALEPVADDQVPFALTATATSGLAISYSSSNPSVATVSGNIVTVLGIGTTTITASQTGNTNHLPATDVTRMLSVQRANPIADAGGPYALGAGAPLLLNAGASIPSGAANFVSYQWDLNGNGTYEEGVSGVNPPAINPSDLRNIHGMTPGENNTIRLLVTDSSSKTATATTTVYLADLTTHTATTSEASNDTWNLAGNWSHGIPADAVNVAISADKQTNANSPDTPAFTGNVNLNTGATLKILGNAEDIRALGTGPMTMGASASLRFRTTQTRVIANPVELAGSATIRAGESTAGAVDLTFNGAITGNHHLLLEGNSSSYIRLANTNAFASISADPVSGNTWDRDWQLQANAGGSLGAGDVTMNDTTSLVINAANAMSDNATLHLNGTKSSNASGKVVMNANDTIAYLFIDGVQQAAGNYNSNGTWLSGPASLIVTGGQSPYEGWAGSSFANSFTDTDSGSNPDSDGLTNLQEFAFGTDPTSSVLGPISFEPGGEVTKPGMPVLMNVAPEGQIADFQAVFGRRKDYQLSGLTYTAKFSADLSRWTDSLTVPTVLTNGNSGNASGMEAVSIPYPATVPVAGGGPNQQPLFFSIGISAE